MPRTEAANQRIRETQRAKILNSARSVFAQQGFAATMADIASAAGVSQGLAYRYFASKEALFRELIEKTAQSSVGTFQRVLEMPGTPGERLNFLISLIFRNRPEGLEYYQLVQHALSDNAIPNEMHESLIQPGRTLQDILRRLIVEGQATGEVVEVDPDQLVITVLACFDGLSRMALRGREHFKNHFPDPTIILRMLKA